MGILLLIQFANASIGFYEIVKAGDAVAALKVIPYYAIFIYPYGVPSQALTTLLITLTSSLTTPFTPHPHHPSHHPSPPPPSPPLTPPPSSPLPPQASLKPSATVKRDGKWQNINATLVVPGDMVLLACGSAVPADCRYMPSYLLSCRHTHPHADIHTLMPTYIPSLVVPRHLFLHIFSCNTPPPPPRRASCIYLLSYLPPPISTPFISTPLISTPLISTPFMSTPCYLLHPLFTTSTPCSPPPPLVTSSTPYSPPPPLVTSSTSCHLLYPYSPPPPLVTSSTPRINEGTIDVDQSALTGESLPVTMYQVGTTVRAYESTPIVCCSIITRTSPLTPPLITPHINPRINPHHPTPHITSHHPS